MTLSSQPLPNLGSPNSTEDSKVRSLLSELQGIVNGGIDTANITNSSVGNGDLASPTAGVWRNVLQVTAATNLDSSTGINDYMFCPATFPPAASANTPLIFTFNAASYAVAGMTTQFRLVGRVMTNGVASTANLTFGCYPITGVAGSGSLSLVLGTLVSGSTVQFSTPAAGSVLFSSSSSFSLTDGGGYAVVLSLTSLIAANAIVAPAAFLQMRHV